MNPQPVVFIVTLCAPAPRLSCKLIKRRRRRRQREAKKISEGSLFSSNISNVSETNVKEMKNILPSSEAVKVLIISLFNKFSQTI